MNKSFNPNRIFWQIQFFILVSFNVSAQSWKDLGISTGIGKQICTDLNNNLYAVCDISLRNNQTVAKWDGTSWIELGANSSPLIINNDINSITSDIFGNMYAAGHFTDSIGNLAVAKWDGTTWSIIKTPFNRGLGTSIDYLYADYNGDIYIGGSFFTIYSGSNVFNIYKWDGGSNWLSLGTGACAFNSIWTSIHTIASDNAGNTYTGKMFNGSGSSYVSIWDGVCWAELYNGTNHFYVNGLIKDVCVDGAGNVYSAGAFTNSSGKTYVAKWDGSNWGELGTGINSLNTSGEIKKIVADHIGNIYAAGSFTNSSGKCYVAKWNGTSWNEVKSITSSLNANANITSISIDSINNIYVAGDFTNSSEKTYIAKWDGNNWTELYIGHSNKSINANYSIDAYAFDKTGVVYAVGGFENSFGNTYVAKWDGNNWTELNNNTSTLSALHEYIKCIAVDSIGNVYAAGTFKDSLGRVYVAKWNGNSWSKLGTGANALNANGIAINTIAIDNQGNLFAAGSFVNSSGKYYVAKWDGVSWSELGGASSSPLNANDDVQKIVIDKYGNLYAGGWFTNSSGKYYIAKWNGITWSELGTGINSLNANGFIKTITIDIYDNVFVCGFFNNNNYYGSIAMWNGTNWSGVGSNTNLISNGRTFQLAADKFGNVYAGGDFTKLSGEVLVAKWDGYIWKEVKEVNTGNGINVMKIVTSLSVGNIGDVYVSTDKLDFNNKYYISKYSTNNSTSLNKKNHYNHGVLVYPNPNNGLFTIAVKEKTQVTITDALGREVFNKELNSGNEPINLSTEKSGVYFVKLTTDNYQIVEKVIIQK